VAVVRGLWLLLAGAAGPIAVAASLAAAPPARAQPPLAGTARLEGSFQLTGRVTVARHVLGERVGDTVLRTWTFSPLCEVGPCQSVALTRQRAAGIDHLVLHLTSVNQYAGTGRFYAPLWCAGRIVAKGESVPFRIRVQITGAALANGVSIATHLTASYTNRTRTNLTRCVAVPGHDAAVYQGDLQL
jgi:hypothetical protein